MNKCCGKCQIVKVLETDFYFSKSMSGYRSVCKTCESANAKEKRRLNPEKCREIDKNAHSRYKKQHPERIREREKKYRKKNREKIVQQERLYRNKNRERINKRMREYRRQNPQARLGHTLRAILNFHMRKRSTDKVAKTVDLLGCSTSEFKRYIESKWLFGMTWENYGQWKLGEPMTWHIDHIKPCDVFDLADMVQQRQCFHHTNMQPLWAIDNLSKSASWNA